MRGRTNQQQQSNFTIFSNSLASNRPSPFFVVAKLIFTPIINLLGFPQSLKPVLSGFWGVLSTIIAVHGIFPTIRVIWGLNRVIRSNRPLETLEIYGPDAAAYIIDHFRPVWSEILSTRLGLSTFSGMVLSSTIFYALKPIAFRLVRWLFTIICSSMGILWTDSLRNIEFLFNYASSVRNFLKDLIGFEFPLPKELTENLPSYKKIGIYIASIFSIGFLVIGLDFWNENIFHYIPYSEIILKFYYDTFYYTLFIPITYSIRIGKAIINVFRNGGL
uniref:Uncharacterized protein n=1 Tax=Fomitiporia mediterranea TaxID=208960 RepID=A0A5B9RCC6_9AGAM|nr:hypothetical protein Fomme_000047 [Fomitiporia mediterranea]QEG57043.1 hypothetical protein Fomme_000047 [Fomitiporia mediterranea]